MKYLWLGRFYLACFVVNLLVFLGFLWIKLGLVDAIDSSVLQEVLVGKSWTMYLVAHTASLIFCAVGSMFFYERHKEGK